MDESEAEGLTKWQAMARRWAKRPVDVRRHERAMYGYPGKSIIGRREMEANRQAAVRRREEMERARKRGGA